MVAAEEEQQVLRSRRVEAGQAGLSIQEARAFASSGVDIGLLRWLVQKKCPLELLRRIVL